VWFLCGFLSILSPVVSLECNIKYCRNNECPRDENQQCGTGSQCRTLTFNFERSGALMLQNQCSSDCDQEEYCSSLAERYSKYNPITNCAVRCCNTDLCNASGTYEVFTAKYICVICRLGGPYSEEGSIFKSGVTVFHYTDRP